MVVETFRIDKNKGPNFKLITCGKHPHSTLFYLRLFFPDSPSHLALDPRQDSLFFQLDKKPLGTIKKTLDPCHIKTLKLAANDSCCCYFCFDEFKICNKNGKQRQQVSYLQKSIHDCSGILVNRCHERVRRAKKIKVKISICFFITWLLNIKATDVEKWLGFLAER